MAGGAAGWEVTPRFGVEAAASWLDRPGADEAFAAALTAHTHLRGLRAVSPFLRGGVGLYRVTFDANARDVPDFYRRRMGAAGAYVRAGRSFTDPSLIAGGGVNVFVSRHVAFRPQIEAIVVRRQSRSHVVTAVTMQVAYHFEEHIITPATPGTRRVLP
jgi:hypothetical protein